MSDRQLLTTGELAEALRLSPLTVMKWRREGRIRPVFSSRGGRHARWDYDDVLRQLSDTERSPQDDQDTPRSPGE